MISRWTGPIIYDSSRSLLKGKDLDRMKKQPAIIVPQEKREEMLTAIKQYYSEAQGEEIGDLRAILLLDFVTEYLAPEFYNQGVSDACQFMNEMVEDVLSLQK